MTSGTILILLATAALFGALGWLLRRPTGRRQIDAPAKVEIENLRPQHARYFSQFRQALAKEDDTFVRGRVPTASLRRWRKERRSAAVEFLLGLDEDFRRLSQLARVVAKLSAEVDRRQQIELLRLSIRFRVLYWNVLLQLRLGSLPLPQIRRIADLVGAFAAEIEAAMLAASQPLAQRGD